MTTLKIVLKTVDTQVPVVTSTSLPTDTMDEHEEAVLFTYSLMESRLDRIGYVLGGTKGQHQEKPRNLSERIQRLEKSFKELSNKTVLLQDAQELGMFHSQHDW